ncbi:MAG: acyl carrier protein [Bacteroidetes bacterium]|nr:acyl carrier protein [Bacteroidota bacterium]
MNDIISELNPIFRKIFNNDSIEINDTTTAGDIDGWDSLTHLDLISTIESHFNIKFRLKDLAKMNTVGSMIIIIQEKIAS